MNPSPAPYHPVVRRLDRETDPADAYERLSRRGGPSVLLESARLTPKTGRYSIVASRPAFTLRAKGGELRLEAFGVSERVQAGPFKALERLLAVFAAPPVEGAPPFTGGAVGYFGYEAKSLLEPRFFPRERPGDLGLPDLYLAFYDEGVVVDHEKAVTHLFVNVRGNKDGKAARRSAEKRLDALEAEVLSANVDGTRDRTQSVGVSDVNRTASGSVDRSAAIRCMKPEDFIRMVNKAKRYIKKGDIYQANLSQRIEFETGEAPLDIYKKLRAVNPGPFFGLLDAGDFQIVSGSPERLLKCEGRQLETRPIAGTRSRGRTAAEDSALSLELFLSEKERAEHVMLVDLERNDLGRVAEYGSVAVDELMALEEYSHVKHIVSNVNGRLRDGLGPVDAFKAFFPGGTITGAPKLRSMQVIDELEPVARGPYTGSMGYFSYSGNMDFNILIRSLVLKDGTAWLQAGAGIVADSDPQKEYAETLHKAEAVLAALRGGPGTRDFLAGRVAAARLP